MPEVVRLIDLNSWKSWRDKPLNKHYWANGGDFFTRVDKKSVVIQFYTNETKILHVQKIAW